MSTPTPTRKRTKTKRPKRITKTTVMSLGFTQRMIDDWLPEPEEAVNPHYRSGPPMLLWLEKDVKRVMRTKRFQAAKMAREHNSEARKKAAARAVETKKQKTRDYVDRMITCIEVAKVNARSRAFEDEILMFHEVYEPKDDIPPDVWQRWVVNHIRHNYTDYDYELYETKGKVGFREEYSRYKCAVLDAIAKVYPYFQGECERQKKALQ